MANDVAQLSLEIESSQALRGAKSLNDLASSADRADRATNKLTGTSNKASRAQSALSTTVNSVDDNLDRMAATAAKTQGKTGRFGQIAQQAGYQVGDFAVQVQGGQSALLAFSQQGGQLLGVFGPGGAVLGAILAVSAAVGGIFLKSIMAANKATGELSITVEETTESYRKFNKVRLDAARVDLDKKLEDENKTLVKLKENTEKLTAARDAEVARLKNIVEQLNSDAAAGQKLVTVDSLRAKSKKGLVAAENELAVAIAAQAEQQKKIDAINVVSGNVKTRLNADLNKQLQQRLIAEQRGIAIQERQLQLSKEQAQFEVGLEVAKNIEQINAQMDLQNKVIQAGMTGSAEEIKKATRELDEFNARLQAQNMLGPNATAEQFEALAAKIIEQKNLISQGDALGGDFIDQLVAEQQRGISVFDETRMGLFERWNETLDGIVGSFQNRDFKSLATQLNAPLEALSTGLGIFSDLSEAVSAKREAQLRKDLQNSSQFSAAEIKNKEAELKAIFDKKQKYDLAQIVGNTAVGVMGQLATGNWLGAAAIGAAGAAQYARVNSQSFESPASGSANVGNEPPPSVQSTTTISSAPQLNFNITGGFDSSAKDQVIEYIQQFAKDGGFVIPPDSENALALRG